MRTATDLGQIGELATRSMRRGVSKLEDWLLESTASDTARLPDAGAYTVGDSQSARATRRTLGHRG